MTLTDAELIAAIESEEALALDSVSGDLQLQRADALDRFRGAPLGNEVEGRSQVVDKSVLDTIHWIMPSLIRIFLGGDQIGQFSAIGPEDEEAAEVETHVCNWYLDTKNDLFSQVSATLTDALLLKNGYTVAYWQKRYDTMTETYIGQSDEELAMLMQDPEVEVVEHTEYPDPEAPQPDPMQQMMGQPMPQPMLHDVKVECKRCEEYPAVESVPPDEMLVSRRHRWTSIVDADFVQWRRRVTIGQLRAEGFKVPDDLPSDDDFSSQTAARERYEWDKTEDETADPSRRIVTFKDTYIRIDLRGKGMPQLWRVCYVGGTKEPVFKEEADIIQFAAFSPIIYPHSHIGMSVYDLINDLSVIKTTLMRQLIDNVFLSNNGRTGVDVTKVNLDDLLVSRPGGIVRFEGNPADGMMPIVTPDISQGIIGGIEYIDGIKEQRTGVTRYSTGLDSNTLNKTATGIQQIQASANQRIELIARTLASGFKDLFLIIHALALKHSTKPVQMKLNNKWVQVNPREWKRRTDFSISVGMGIGTPEQQAQKLMMMAPLMQQAQAMGLAGPQEAYNLGNEMWKALGYKHSDKFLHPPQMQPAKGPDGQPVMGPDGKPKMEPVTPPPQKDPMVQAAEVKAQADAQANMQKMQAQQQTDAQKQQADIQKYQADAARADKEATLKYQLESQRMQNEIAAQNAQAEADASLAHFKANLDAQLEREKMALMAQLEREKMSVGYQQATQVATLSKPEKPVEKPAEPQKVPKRYTIKRGPDGRAASIDVHH